MALNKFTSIPGIVCATIFAVLISSTANAQTWKLNSLDGKKIDSPANTYRAEQKYLCELSRIGKLIVKPLLKDSVIHYENAITDVKDKRNDAQNGVSDFTDTAGNTSVRRFHRQKSKILELAFYHSAKGDSCTYHLGVMSESRILMLPFVIDENGHVISRNNKEIESNEERISAQREVNAWLTYFE